MIDTVLTDIGGAICPLDFFEHELRDYADHRLAGFVRERRTESAVRRQLDAAARLAGLPSHDSERLIAELKTWAAADSPPAPLAALRELIGAEGLRGRQLKTPLYADAVRVLRDWFENRVIIYTIADETRAFQDLLFRHSRYGDVTPLIREFFDGELGHPDLPETYRRFVRLTGAEPRRTLFLSDSEADLDAAKAAGLATIRICRATGTGKRAVETESVHPVFESFDDIDLGRFG